MTLQIDCHVHVGPPRYPGLGDLRSVLRSGGTTHVVLVQTLGNFDNEPLLMEAAEPEVIGAIVAVDLDLSDASTELYRLAANETVVGVRLQASGSWEESADARLWPAIADTCRLVSVPGVLDRVVGGEFERLAVRWPNVLFRLEHAGGTLFSEIAPDDPRFAGLFRLHRHPNICVMWSGFFHNAGMPYPYEGAHRHLELLFDRFGPDRICWSGDVNRAGLRDGDYERDAALLSRLSFLSEADRHRIRANVRLAGRPS